MVTFFPFSFAFLALCVPLLASISTVSAAIPRPNAAQIDLAEMGLSQFLCYGINQYGGKTHIEHNCVVHPREPCLPIDLFDPTDLDTDQWVHTTSLFGAKEICLTAHHEGGFCLWPTAYSNYSVKYAPYKKDIVGMFVASCHKYGIKPCFYVGPNANGYMTYVENLSPSEFLEAQLGMFRELLSNYGPIHRLWWDHYPKGCEDDPNDPCPGGFPEAWIAFTDLVRELQPQLIICPGPDCTGHLGEGGKGSYPAWYNCDYDGKTPALKNYSCSTRGPTGKVFHPLETCVTPLHGWYDPAPPAGMDAPSLFQHYLDSVGIGYINTINMAPGRDGLIPQFQVDLLSKVGKAINDSFNQNLGIVRDAWGPCSQPVQLELSSDVTFDAVMIREDVSMGQRLSSYDLSHSLDGKNWSGFKNGTVHGQTVGAKLIDVVGNTTARWVRMQCKSALEEPVYIKQFSLHRVQAPTA